MEKRNIAILIPYRRTESGFEYFLQKRTQDAPTYAGMFGFFGGGIEEGETTEQALIREINEELNIVLDSFFFLGKFKSKSTILNCYFIEVGISFEDEVMINEGEYGKFMSNDVIQSLKDCNETDKSVVVELEARLV